MSSERSLAGAGLGQAVPVAAELRGTPGRLVSLPWVSLSLRGRGAVQGEGSGAVGAASVV